MIPHLKYSTNKTLSHCSCHALIKRSAKFSNYRIVIISIECKGQKGIDVDENQTIYENPYQ